jgi:hypothetical protein
LISASTFKNKYKFGHWSEITSKLFFFYQNYVRSCEKLGQINNLLQKWLSKLVIGELSTYFLMRTKSEGFICFDIEKWPWNSKLHNFSKRYEDDLNVICKQWPKIQILDGLYYLSHWSSQEFRSWQDSGHFKVQGST